MKLIWYTLFTLILVTGHSFDGHTQPDRTQLENLSFYADVLTNASSADHRMRAHEIFYHDFKSLLNSEKANEIPLDELIWISQVVSPDSVFRMLSWQLEITEDQHRYFCFVQMLDGQNTVFELNDKRSLRSEFGTHTADTWYGALYYGVQPFENAENTTSYLVLGFNAHDSRTNYRVADVMNLTAGGVEFGAEIFLPGEEAVEKDVKSRIILEYADAAAGMMRFDREREMLVYDHVITIFTDGPDAGPLKVPDGSYHGYSLKQGTWHFTDKLFDLIMDEAPRLRGDEDVKRDLLGRPQKN